MHQSIKVVSLLCDCYERQLTRDISETNFETGHKYPSYFNRKRVMQIILHFDDSYPNDGILDSVKIWNDVRIYVLHKQVQDDIIQHDKFVFGPIIELEYQNIPCTYCHTTQKGDKMEY